MIGKASEIKITDPLKGAGSVRGWLAEHPDSIVMDINATADGDVDYFHIIYKEAKSA